MHIRESFLLIHVLRVSLGDFSLNFSLARRVFLALFSAIFLGRIHECAALFEAGFMSTVQRMNARKSHFFIITISHTRDKWLEKTEKSSIDN